jgi:flagellar M-ring protein FliF
LSGLLSTLSELTQRMGGPRRVLLLGGALVLVVLVWGVGRWASAPVYVTLYQDLEFQVAAKIEESLNEAHIPNKLGVGGTEVLVPVADVARARVALARDGIGLGGRPGLELFDKPSWGMTDFAQRVTFQRALEGELARTIAGIRGVEKTQVHLAIPAPSALRRMDKQASASVVLSLTPGATLLPETIQGITYIVSNSVEQLSAENVAVMDDEGELLSAPSGNGEDHGVTNRQMEMQRSLEAAMVAKIHALLEPVLGAGNVRAEVTARMNFDKVERAVETVGPTGTSATGDTAGAPAASTVGGSARAIEQSEASIGKLLRLTAAVLVDKASLTPGDGSAAAGDAPLDLAELEAMVRDAIGIDAERGDRLSMMSVPFESVPVPDLQGGSTESKPGPDILGIVERLMRPLVGLVALVILALVAMRALKLQPSPAGAAGSLSAIAGQRNLEGPAGGAGGLQSGQNPGSEDVQPEASLQVVRGWLSDN